MFKTSALYNGNSWFPKAMIEVTDRADFTPTSVHKGSPLTHTVKIKVTECLTAAGQNLNERINKKRPMCISVEG